MKKTEIELKNCFGIGEFIHKFNFEELETNSFLIYAPNGTMKTSFAKTLNLISKDDSKSIGDKVYPDRPTNFNILADGNAIVSNSILVVNAEDNNYDSSSKISSFIASKDLKEKYDNIYSELDIEKSEYIKRLKNISQSTDCETEFVNTYKNTDRDTFYELLSILSKSLIATPEKYDFRYNDIFDKKGNVKKFLDKNQQILNQYITNYKELLKNSTFFKSSENSFGTYQANELLKSISDNSYFDAGHKFVLNDNEEIKSSEELAELLQKEITSILNDDKLKQTFEKVDNAIGSNTELRAFKSVIEKNNFLLVELVDYDKFRKKIWLNYISTLKEETNSLTTLFQNRKAEIEAIIKEAKKESETWKEIIKTFNDRFFVPFEIILRNQDDVILKQETANLEFDYKDTNESPIPKDKNSLLLFLEQIRLNNF